MSANGIGPAAAYPYVVSLDIQEVQLMIPDFTTSSSFCMEEPNIQEEIEISLNQEVVLSH